MIIKGEKGRLIITLNLINSECYAGILRSLLRTVQMSQNNMSQDDVINIMLLLEDMMPDDKQLERMFENAMV